jgi:hypothetical protein
MFYHIIFQNIAFFFLIIFKTALIYHHLFIVSSLNSIVRLDYLSIIKGKLKSINQFHHYNFIMK